jgi:hypothetical protein
VDTPEERLKKADGFHKLALELKRAVVARLGLASVSLYLHAAVHHFPGMIREHGSLQRYSCESLERINSEAKRTHTNRWTQPRQVKAARATKHARLAYLQIVRAATLRRRFRQISPLGGSKGNVQLMVKKRDFFRARE